jgi:outer membrane protein OmpA-like peptidoglycan-associated protein
MQASRLFSIPVAASIVVALVAATPGAPEASRHFGNSSAVLSSPHPGFDASRSIPHDRADSPPSITLRLARAKDTDGDGVGDRQDACPETPLQAIVDSSGCPTDQDQDGVFDGIDQCAGTVLDATIDGAGCPRDSDSDGILDGLDMCPETDPRTLINEEGCPYDSDGDGVFDGIDECPATPAGAVVDETGCRVDTDGDGVADGLDKCPDTNPEAEADESGCSWVQKGEIVLPTIRFGVGSANLAPGSSPALNEVAEILKQNPDVMVEIGGHTDNEGPARLNRKISLERAEEVKRYLAARGVPMARMVTKGYGEVHPIASNRHAEGRALNRRIELKILPPIPTPDP